MEFKENEIYKIHFSSRKRWFEVAGKIKILKIEYLKNPEITNNKNNIKEYATIGEATFQYIDTKTYDKKICTDKIVEYYDKNGNVKDLAIIFTKKNYRSLFLD